MAIQLTIEQMGMRLACECECKPCAWLPAVHALTSPSTPCSKGNKCSYYEANSRVSGHKVTVKEHHFNNYEGQEPAEEVKILSKLSHQNVPRLREVFLTDNSLFMVMDFIDSKRLKNFIDISNKSTPFGPADVRNILKSLLAGIHYCHERNIIIRNLTPDTIMVKKSGGIINASTIYEVKITDFSCAVPTGTTKNLADHPLFDWADVPYLAPEALLDQAYGRSMDMWSVGVLLFMMVSGELPFVNDDDKLLINCIKVTPLPLQYQSITRHATHLMSGCAVLV